MNVRESNSVRTTIFIHSINLLGDFSPLSSYRVGYKVQSKEFTHNKKVGLNLLTCFDDNNFVVVEEMFPQNIDFQLVYKNNLHSIKSNIHSFSIGDQKSNVIKSFQIYFDNLEIVALVTIYISEQN